MYIGLEKHPDITGCENEMHDNQKAEDCTKKPNFQHCFMKVGALRRKNKITDACHA